MSTFDDFKKWLNRAPDIGMGSDPLFIDFDKLLFSMLDPDRKTLVIKSLKQGQRKWLHLRCEHMGLITKSGDVIKQQGSGKMKTIKDITIDKPDGWEMPWDNAYPVVIRHRKQKEPKLVECDNCWSECEGLYHWSGMGPLCEECIEADEEWCGLKWEPDD